MPGAGRAAVNDWIHAVSAFIGLFAGKNIGKMVVDLG
jgi:NADPH-dependent curcumin reductase CurA